MFTGIITATTDVAGTKKTKNGLTLSFKKPVDWKDLELGESVATDGVCLTLADIRDDEYDCYLMNETLNKTSFGRNIPKHVNLERALRASDRLDGHFVLGHVDDVGVVTDITIGKGWDLSIRFPLGNKELVVYKGSITVNGVALTITEVKKDVLSVSLIPYTLEHTSLGDLKVGSIVNLEFDIIGKYVAAMLEKRQ